MNNDEIAIAALAACRVNAASLNALLGAREGLEWIFKAGAGELTERGLDGKTASTVAKADRKAAERMLERAEKGGAEIFSILDPRYPPLLKEITDPPLILFARGDATCLKEFCISIVGSRKSSRNGINIAYQLAGDLARCGVTIVSGFAFGIDIAAHLAAAENGRTAAVLGSGFENIYPREHIKYLDRICENGCVITEFAPEEKPAPYNFPRRNRVISGLSKGVIVCEASKKSGSLITVRLALEQNRDVFAVPASPLSGNNATNRLIKDGAVLTETYLDVISEYKETFESICGREEEPSYSPPEEHRAVWERLNLEPLSLDELAAELDYGALILSLTALEIEGRIEKNSEGRYAITKRR
jgi:DNA processing protein